jgi:hypothetical protein
MSGNVVSSAWDGLPVAFAWWSTTPLTAGGTIAIDGDHRIGAPPPAGCETELGAQEVFRRFASWRSHDWIEPCGLAPWRLTDLRATVTFDNDGQVNTATLTDPALTDTQRACVVRALHERRICPGAHASMHYPISVGP